MEKRNLRKERIGVVTSNKMEKSIVVAEVRKVKHPLYGKFVLKTKKYVAHDEKNDCNIGDTVKIADSKGKIIDITLSNVHLLNEDDDIVYIPNNNVFASQIINYTRRELKKSSIDFELDVNYIDQLEKLEREIIFALKDQQDYCAFKFQYILNDPLNKEHDNRIRRQVIAYVMRQVMQSKGRR